METTTIPVQAPKLTGNGQTLTAHYGSCKLTAMVTGDYSGEPLGWTVWFSVNGTDTSYVFDESTIKDWSAKTGKHDRRKPAERVLADLRATWREYLAQSFIWTAYRHSFPADLSNFDKPWPDLEDFELDWS